MPRKNLIRTNLYPYHVTSRSHNKVEFPLPLEHVWALIQEALKEAYAVHQVDVVSFVLMNNHYHLLLFTPLNNLDKFIYEFNKRIALKIQKASGQINQVFGGRYKWCLIQSENYFKNCYRYIYQNPLRAGVVMACEDYNFSTLRYYKQKRAFCIPIHHYYDLLDKDGLIWLNNRIDEEEKLNLKKGLYRSVLE